MLDKISLSLLKQINNKITDDSYKVIEISELLQYASRVKRLNESSLAQALHNLQKEELIDIKYSDENVYCLAVRPQARKVFQVNKQEIKQYKYFKRLAFLYALLAGIFSFIGTALAIYLFM